MKKLFAVFALFAALMFVVSCGSSKKENEEPDNGITVTDEDSSGDDSQDTEPTDTEQSDNEQPDNGDSTPEQPDNGDSTTDDADSTTDDTDATQEDDDSATDDNDDTESDDDTEISTEPKEGIYLGIIGFNKDQYIKKIGFLNKSTIDDYTSFIDSLNKADYTGLYFADYTALKMMRDYDEPPELNNVALVTFTDGLDNISTVKESYDPENYGDGDPDVYRDTLHEKIVNDKIHDTEVAAYTIGLKGNDVNDTNEFKTTLEKLASEPKEKFVFYTENMEDVMNSFDIIAKSLNSFSKSVSLNVSVPGGYKDGQKLRFTFDINCDSDSNSCDGQATDSHLYIEGTFRKSEDGGRNLEEITYHGFTDGLATIPGTLEEVTYRFVFEDIKYADNNDPLLNKDYQKINLWKMSSNSIWDHETEFKRDNSSKLDEKKNSALIMLVLDCTTSLGNEFEKMKEAGKDFVKTLANSDSESNSRVSECTGLPEHAKWNKTDKIQQTWDEETGWQPTTDGSFNKTPSTTECVFKCEDGYGWSGSECVEGFKECDGSSESLPCVDPATGYFWSRPSDNTMGWSSAQTHCNSVTDGGKNDWKLPGIDELRTVIINCENTETDGTCRVTDSHRNYNNDYKKAECSCEQNDTQGYYSKLGFSANYWTSQLDSSDTTYSWYISFKTAEILSCKNGTGLSSSASNKVVCVRH